MTTGRDVRLTAGEAAGRLTVSRATFYRLVARYAIRRVLLPSPTDGRPLVRYLASDIDALWHLLNDPKNRRRRVA